MHISLSSNELFWLASYYETTFIPGFSPEQLFPFGDSTDGHRDRFDAGQISLVERGLLLTTPLDASRMTVVLSDELARITDILFEATITLAVTIAAPNQRGATYFSHRNARLSGIVTHVRSDQEMHDLVFEQDAAVWRNVLPTLDARGDDVAAAFEIDASEWSAILSKSAHSMSSTDAGRALLRASASEIEFVVLLTLLTIERSALVATSATVQLVCAHNANWSALPVSTDRLSVRTVDTKGAFDVVQAMGSAFLADVGEITPPVI